MHLEPLTISVNALADNLGVARKTVSQLVNGHMGVSAEMALRLEKAFKTTPELSNDVPRLALKVAFTERTAQIELCWNGQSIFQLLKL
jgi:plasmid maintenance system antidote protein VapI